MEGAKFWQNSNKEEENIMEYVSWDSVSYLERLSWGPISKAEVHWQLWKARFFCKVFICLLL